MSEVAKKRAKGQDPPTAIVSVRVPTPMQHYFESMAGSTGLKKNDLLKSALAAFIHSDDARAFAIRMITDPMMAWQLNMDGKPEMTEAERGEIEALITHRAAAQQQVANAQQELAKAMEAELEAKGKIATRHAQANMPPGVREQVEKKLRDTAEQQDAERQHCTQLGLM